MVHLYCNFAAETRNFIEIMATGTRILCTFVALQSKKSTSLLYDKGDIIGR